MAKRDNKPPAKQLSRQPNLFGDDDWKKFHEIAQRALVFKYRPSTKMLEQIADVLEAICCADRKLRGEELSRFDQALWLMDEVTIGHERWDEWEGVAALRRVYAARFRPQSTFQSPEQPVEQCQKCHGSGIITPVDGQQHVPRWAQT